MKSIKEFKSIEDIAVFYQYLYLDERNYIDIKNVIDVPLRIKMDDNFRFMVKNLNFPDSDYSYEPDFDADKILDIIDVMKNSPSKRDKDSIGGGLNSYWDEIKFSVDLKKKIIGDAYHD